MNTYLTRTEALWLLSGNRNWLAENNVLLQKSLNYPAITARTHGKLKKRQKSGNNETI